MVDRSEAERDPQRVRDLVRGWLEDQGWQPADLQTPGFIWRISATGSEGRKLDVFQPRDRADRVQIQAAVMVTGEHRSKLDQMEPRERSNLLWDLRFRLVGMGLDFAGMADSPRTITIVQHIHYDGLSKDAFLQRVAQVHRGLLVTLWTIGRKLEEG